MKVSAREARPLFAFWTIDFTETLQTHREMKASAREARFFAFWTIGFAENNQTLRKMKVSAREARFLRFEQSISLKTFKTNGK